jgi:hypothetical protein
MSHVHAVRSEVTEIANILESFHCSCFVAHVQIEPSEDWRQVIARAPHTCHALVAYVTPDFHESLWTDQEVGWTLGRRLPVIPISVRVQPYGFFGAIQAIQAGQWGAWTIAFPGVPRGCAEVLPRGATSKSERSDRGPHGRAGR